jgi:hypothetical protein
MIDGDPKQPFSPALGRAACHLDIDQLTAVLVDDGLDQLAKRIRYVRIDLFLPFRSSIVGLHCNDRCIEPAAPTANGAGESPASTASITHSPKKQKKRTKRPLSRLARWLRTVTPSTRGFAHPENAVSIDPKS